MPCVDRQPDEKPEANEAFGKQAGRVNKSPGRIRNMFAQIAPRYDLLNHLLSFGVDFYWRWQTVRLSSVPDQAKVLDVCCGTGDLAIAFRRYSNCGRIVGIDFCEPMVRLGRQKLRRLRLRNIDLLVGDALQLPFVADSFHVVAVAFGLRNTADHHKALAEMVRVCRPGGRVAILEFSLPKRKIVRSAYLWYFRWLLPRVGQLLARNRYHAYGYLPASVAEFPQGSDLLKDMNMAGLTSLSLRPLSGGIATLYLGRKPQ